MNSYGKEDAITALTGKGIVNLADRDYNGHALSYVYNGGYGTLDYALATPAMASICGKAANLETVEWNTNSDESPRIGYADQDNVQAGAAETVFRSSDHDPIVFTCNMPNLVPAEKDDSANDIVMFVGGMALMAVLAALGFGCYNGTFARLCGGDKPRHNSQIVTGGGAPIGELDMKANNPKYEEGLPM
jgi:hypothetical protein